MQSLARFVAMTFVLLAALSHAGGSDKGTPSYLVKELTEALSAKKQELVLSAYISGPAFAAAFPKGDYTTGRRKFAESIQEFLTQDIPLDDMKFVQFDFRYCPEPIVIPKGYNMGGSILKADMVVYDNLHAVVNVGDETFSFKVDAIVAVDGRWALVNPIGLLERRN